jgi:transcriptional regulator
MRDRKTDLLQGTLDLLILKTLTSGPMHGWGLAQRIQERSGQVFLVNQGSLYPALHRLERERLIKAEWGASDNNRRARYYEITPLGHKKLGEEKDTWTRVAAAITRVLEFT